jgi:hypothetical protein
MRVSFAIPLSSAYVVRRWDDASLVAGHAQQRGDRALHKSRGVLAQSHI